MKDQAKMLVQDYRAFPHHKDILVSFSFLSKSIVVVIVSHMF